MARRLRVWFPGAMYHITNRGNRRAALFYDNSDRKAYLELIEEVRFYFPFTLHSYCLMTNHIHLQLETINHHTMHIMKMLNSRYAMYFNKRHRLVGHVFQGRYGSELIDTVDYQLEVSRYIHLNPVDAKMVKSAENYRWSSYVAYIFNETNPHVTTHKILSYFPNPQKENYRKYVERGSSANLIESMENIER
ncbi:transposase [Bacillus sp. V3B]|uniref:transposase n=1 Tax=Bacillus sp. V3B TaxID=2804915 RepID=UPI0021097473|nr:transposase [Bacillus sp. V3B]MCQ6274690.1 transposase [Bacillus sp. V3B]